MVHRVQHDFVTELVQFSPTVQRGKPGPRWNTAVFLQLLALAHRRYNSCYRAQRAAEAKQSLLQASHPMHIRMPGATHVICPPCNLRGDVGQVVERALRDGLIGHFLIAVRQAT